MARILVIEDEKDIQDVLEYNLRQGGHDVQLASRGREGLELALAKPPDLVILDLMLPDTSGTSVCKSLKSDPRTNGSQVLILTAKGEEIDRVLGFELGADDYVVKPFSVRELMLRVTALLRRGNASESAPPSGATVTFGVLKVDKDAHRVWVSGQEIELTALEFKLIVTLHERKNRVQTREALLKDVWGIEADITTRTIDTHVKRLREKLGDAADYIRTVRGVGYRFADSPDEGGR
jgi:two-component system phosphate regulon response regulator PhoB